MSGILVTARDLADALAGPNPPAVLDVRYGGAAGERPGGRGVYETGHIPGAVYADIDQDLAAHGLPATEGRHPLPAPADLQAAARRWGIREGQPVVVHDDFKNFWAARAWWLLTYAGIAEVRLLDGSLRAWRSAGLPLETGDVVPPPGDVTLSYGHLPLLDIDGAGDFPDAGVLLDSRAHERYTGDVEPIDPRAGHIPGAKNSPIGGLTDEDGRFLPAAALRERYAALGVVDGTPVATYCGSGITASYQAAALTIAGFAPILYPGSFSQWANSEREVAVGDEPYAPGEELD